MSTEKILEEFEAAFIEMMVKRHGEGYHSSAAYMLSEKDDAGEYRSGITFFALWAWQASRAAIEVELPERMEFAEKGGDYFDGARNGYNQCLDACAVSLKFAGLKVKPC